MLHTCIGMQEHGFTEGIMGFWRCCAYYAVLGVTSFLFGRLLPKRLFHGDRFPFRCAAWEAELYRVLRVRRWQNRLPDMSRIVPRLIPAKRLTADYRERLPRMIEETCVAEFVHALLCVLGLGAVRLWRGSGGRVFAALYILLGNLPFIIIQRYNRPRLMRLLAAQERRKAGRAKEKDSDFHERFDSEL